ncbi:MAG: hypothetical protein U0354_13955 [Candidatus Sericytochromatia bacterium]
MGEIIDLGQIYWSEPTTEETMQDLIEELKVRDQETENLKRQLVKIKKKLLLQENKSQKEKNNNKNHKESLKISKFSPELKPTLNKIENLELDKSFWKVPRQLKNIRKELSKLDILIQDHLFDKLNSWQKEYDLFSINELSKEFNTSRTRIKQSINKLIEKNIILKLDNGNIGKIIFFNTESNRKLIENIKTGKIKIEINNKVKMNLKIINQGESKNYPNSCVQSDSGTEYKSTQSYKPQIIENSIVSDLIKNNQSKNNLNKQSDQADFEKENKFLFDKKYSELKFKLKKKNLNNQTLNNLIQEHGIDKVFQCYKDLESKEKSGLKIFNMAGLLINTLKDFNYFEESEEPLETENNKALLDEINKKYLRLIQCIEPNITYIYDLDNELYEFSNKLINKFHTFQKNLTQKIEDYFKYLNINSKNKKDDLIDEILSWIKKDDLQFKNSILNLIKIINSNQIKDLIDNFIENKEELNKFIEYIKGIENDK